MDRIWIRDLRVNALVGVYPTERERRQGLILNLQIELDLSNAAVSDRLEDTVNYAEIEAQVAELAANSKFFLIERLAGAVGELVLGRHPAVERVTARVEKPGAARIARSIAILK